MKQEHKVYIRLNADNSIVDINSSAFIDDISDWIEIDSGDGDKYCHAQHNYLPTPNIRDENGIPLYKYENGTVIKRTETEKRAELDARPPEPPTIEDRLQAFENGYASLLIANCTQFDGIKYVFDRDKPLDVVLPMPVVPNAFYRYEGKLYVGLQNGTATLETFNDFFAKD